MTTTAYPIARVNARAAFAEALHDCEARVDQLRRHMTACEHIEHKITWADAGELGRLLTDLNEIAEYLHLDDYAHI